jgi:hypothetical protein
MNTKTTFLLAVCIWIATYSCSFAATVPAGTTIIVRTVNSMSSHERVGKTFKAELAHAVRVNGKVVLPAGTAASGVVATSLRGVQGRVTSSLTVDLTAVSVNGGMQPVKTTGAYKLEPTYQRTSRGAAVYGRDYIFPHNTILTFQLAQPLNL